jgi:hypothetical protein
VSDVEFRWWEPHGLLLGGVPKADIIKQTQSRPVKVICTECNTVIGAMHESTDDGAYLERWTPPLMSTTPPVKDPYCSYRSARAPDDDEWVVFHCFECGAHRYLDGARLRLAFEKARDKNRPRRVPADIDHPESVA